MKGLAAYRAVSHRSASSTELILLVYERIITEQQRAISRLEQGQVGEAGPHLRRARELMVELLNALDDETAPELTANLRRLYTWGIRQLIQAGQQGDASLVVPVQAMCTSLYEAWRSVIKEAA